MLVGTARHVLLSVVDDEVAISPTETNACRVDRHAWGCTSIVASILHRGDDIGVAARSVALDMYRFVLGEDACVILLECRLNVSAKRRKPVVRIAVTGTERPLLVGVE